MKNFQVFFMFYNSARLYFLGGKYPLIGGAVFAILVGMLISLFYKEKKFYSTRYQIYFKVHITIGSRIFRFWNEFI